MQIKGGAFKKKFFSGNFKMKKVVELLMVKTRNKGVIFAALLVIILGVMVGGNSTAQAFDDQTPYIKFQGSLLASDIDQTEPAGVELWNANADEYFAFGKLGKDQPRIGTALEQYNFNSLAGINLGDIQIEVSDMTLNKDETDNTGNIDPANIEFYEKWENGTALLTVNGEAIATCNNLELKSITQVTQNNVLVNEFIDFKAIGDLEAVAGSNLSENFVNEFEQLFGFKKFQMIFISIKGHDDLGIEAQPLVDNALSYEFMYTALFTGAEQQNPPVSQITNLVATNVRDTTLTLNWDAPVDGASGYYIFLNGVHNTATNNTYYNFSGLTAGQDYTITIKSFEEGLDGQGQSIDVHMKNPVSLQYVNHDDTSVTLSWNEPISPTSVQLQYATNSAFYLPESINIAPGETNKTITGLDSDTKYYFRLNVLGGANDAFSNVIDVTTNTNNIQTKNMEILATIDGYEFYLRNVDPLMPTTLCGKVYKDGQPYPDSSNQLLVTFNKITVGGIDEYQAIVNEYITIGEYTLEIYDDAALSNQVYHVDFNMDPMVHITEPFLHGYTNQLNMNIAGYISNYDDAQINDLNLTLNGTTWNITSNLASDGTFTYPVTLQDGYNHFSVSLDYNYVETGTTNDTMWGEITYRDSILPTITLKTEKITVMPGEFFDVNIMISNIQDLYGTSIDLVFNPNLLEVVPVLNPVAADDLKAILPGDAFVDFADAVNNFDNENGKLHYASMLIGEIPGIDIGDAGANLGIIRFKAKELGEVNFSFDMDLDTPKTLPVEGKTVLFKLSDSLEQKIDYEAIDSVVMINNLSGDVNGDGAVDISDISMVAMDYGLTYNSNVFNALYDLKCDGIIDIYDLVVLARNFGK